jgi:hypothetical protein
MKPAFHILHPDTTNITFCGRAGVSGTRPRRFVWCRRCSARARCHVRAQKRRARAHWNAMPAWERCMLMAAGSTLLMGALYAHNTRVQP